MDEKLVLKNHIKEARAEAKLSQAALAKMVGYQGIPLVLLRQGNLFQLRS